MQHSAFLPKLGVYISNNATNVTEVRSGLQRSGKLTPTPPDYFHFQTCSLHPQPTLTQVTPLEAIYQIFHGSLLSHKILYTTYYTYVVALPNAFK